MFYISLSDPNWPSVPPDAVPNIKHLEDNIVLKNDQDESLKPRYVWGKRNDELTTEEKLVVMFPLRDKLDHFLAQSRTMRLEFGGLDHTVALEFPVSRMR